MSQTAICRLCIDACKDYKSLYNGKGQANELYEMTFEYFHPKIVDMNESKHLTVICLQCFHHIYEFHSFQTSVMMSQLKLLDGGHHTDVVIKTEVDNEFSDDFPAKIEEDGTSLHLNEAEIHVDDTKQESGDGDVLSAEAQERTTVDPLFRLASVEQECISLPSNDDIQLKADDGAVLFKEDLDDSSIVPLFRIENVISLRKDNDTSKSLALVAPLRIENVTSHSGDKKYKRAELLSVACPSEIPSTLGDYDVDESDAFAKDNFSVAEQNNEIANKAAPLSISVAENNETNNRPISKIESKEANAIEAGTEANLEDVNYLMNNMTQNEIENVAKTNHVVLRANEQAVDSGDIKVVAQNDSLDNDEKKRFQCPLCCQSYAFKYTLNLHINRHHIKTSKIANRRWTRSFGVTSQISPVLEASNDITESRHTRKASLVSNAVNAKVSISNNPEISKDDLETKPRTRQGSINHFESSSQLVVTPVSSLDTNSGVDNSQENVNPKKRFQCSLCNNSYAFRTTLQLHMGRQHVESRNIANRKSKLSRVPINQDWLRVINSVSAKTSESKNNRDNSLESKGQIVTTTQAFLASNSVSEFNAKTKKSNVSKDVLKSKRQSVDKQASSTSSDPSEDFEFDYDDKTKKFGCKLCDKSYNFKQVLVFHMSRIHWKNHVPRVATHKCDECDRKFVTKSGLRYHYKTTHAGLHCCSICSKVFKDYSVYCKHRSKCVDNDAAERYKCTLCVKTFRHKRFLTRHIRVQHDREKYPSRSMCKVCGNSFETLKGLKLHLKSKHPEFDYTTNKFKFDQKYTLEFHSRNHDTSTPRLNCEFCGSSFTTRKNLKIHMATNHRKQYLSRQVGYDCDYDETKKMFSCKLCAASYKLRYNLNTHMEKMHPEACKIAAKSSSAKISPTFGLVDALFNCNLCDKAFNLECYLKTHMERHHGEKDTSSPKFEFDYDETTKMFKCKLCEKSYGFKANLKRHMTEKHWVTNEIIQTNDINYDDSNKLFKCQMCENSYIFKNHLIRHMERQHSQSPRIAHECRTCKKVFLSKSLLDTHEFVKHPPPDVYPCDLCQTSFESHFLLYTHKVNVHGVHKQKCNICGLKFKIYWRYKRHLASHKVNKRKE